MRSISFLLVASFIIVFFIVFVVACAKGIHDSGSDIADNNNFTIPSFPDNPFEKIGSEPEADVSEGFDGSDDRSNAQRIAVRMFQFGFDPEVIEVKKGERVVLTITSADVGHGFALPEFGINEKVPPEGSVTVRFIADIGGEFEFFESVYSGKGWKDMKGKLIVR